MHNAAAAVAKLDCKMTNEERIVDLGKAEPIRMRLAATVQKL